MHFATTSTTLPPPPLQYTMYVVKGKNSARYLKILRAFSKKVLNVITVLEINGDSVSNFGVRYSVLTIFDGNVERTY